MGLGVREMGKKKSLRAKKKHAKYASFSVIAVHPHYTSPGVDADLIQSPRRILWQEPRKDKVRFNANRPDRTLRARGGPFPRGFSACCAAFPIPRESGFQIDCFIVCFSVSSSSLRFTSILLLFILVARVLKLKLPTQTYSIYSGIRWAQLEASWIYPHCVIVLWRLLNVEAKSKAYIQWFRPIGIHSASFPPHSSPTLIPIPSLSIVHQKKKERKKERQTMLRMVIQFFFMLVFCKTLLWVPLAGEFTIVEVTANRAMCVPESSHVQGIEAHVLKQSAGLSWLSTAGIFYEFRNRMAMVRLTKLTKWERDIVSFLRRKQMRNPGRRMQLIGQRWWMKSKGRKASPRAKANGEHKMVTIDSYHPVMQIMLRLGDFFFFMCSLGNWIHLKGKGNQKAQGGRDYVALLLQLVKIKPNQLVGSRIFRTSPVAHGWIIRIEVLDRTQQDCHKCIDLDGMKSSKKHGSHFYKNNLFPSFLIFYSSLFEIYQLLKGWSTLIKSGDKLRFINSEGLPRNQNDKNMMLNEKIFHLLWILSKVLPGRYHQLILAFFFIFLGGSATNTSIAKSEFGASTRYVILSSSILILNYKTFSDISLPIIICTPDDSIILFPQSLGASKFSFSLNCKLLKRFIEEILTSIQKNEMGGKTQERRYATRFDNFSIVLAFEPIFRKKLGGISAGHSLSLTLNLYSFLYFCNSKCTTTKIIKLLVIWTQKFK
ncbi:hypothetical protein VP01_2192g1 [Puccinia sorghi]|uniref:Uncharacterized protein n=1 Tax=Puccinia sorghi TaxID=27349 RepID=A0A0L6V995_9BASI|nr:hypothetical protein VP01_2192g1 [Puccinia sorghi]